jgi:hypothetical protein
MKIKEFIKELTSNREKLIQFSVFLVLSVLVFVGMTFFKDTFQAIGSTVLLIELIVLTLVAWAFAGHVVIKSLFLVGASLSLIIFLAQSYCDVSNLTQSSNDAFKSLLGFSIIYLGFDFIRSLYKEVMSHRKRMKEVNNGKNPWFFLVPFALFIGVFLWQLYQVMFPILNSLCIYQNY